MIVDEQEEKGAGQEHRELHIFVNRRKFGEADGVAEVMTGGQIAALVGVPADNAVVRRDRGNDQGEIGIATQVHVKVGDHFLVTRRTVEGGHAA